MIYCFDIDGTICTKVENSEYGRAKPYKDVVDEINRLYEEGNEIILMTARGSVSDIDWTVATAAQMKSWGVKHHRLITNQKPHAHWFIDDRAINIVDWRKRISPRKGLIAGAFDILHPGYIKMFKKTQEICNYLYVALHNDPTIEENSKIKPVLSANERAETLLSLKYIDEVVLYSSEEELYKMLLQIKPDVRFLGDDYINKTYTGDDLGIEVHYLNRDHGWSTTKLKNMIKEG